MRPVIELDQDADASTFPNLSAQQFLDELMRDAAHPLAPEQLRQDARTVLHWLGVSRPSNIDSMLRLRFGRAFLMYLEEGRAPSRSLAPVFEKFSHSGWLAGKVVDVGLTDEMRGVFARLLASPEETSRYAPASQSELLYWSEKIGCGATMKLRSSEICMVSVARVGVLVKADKPGRFRRRSVGFFAATI
jgi:hypothetical protein